jgi:hypothetical protein
MDSKECEASNGLSRRKMGKEKGLPAPQICCTSCFSWHWHSWQLHFYRRIPDTASIRQMHVLKSLFCFSAGTGGRWQACQIFLKIWDGFTLFIPRNVIHIHAQRQHKAVPVTWICCIYSNQFRFPYAFIREFTPTYLIPNGSDKTQF